MRQTHIVAAPSGGGILKATFMIHAGLKRVSVMNRRDYITVKMLTAAPVLLSFQAADAQLFPLSADLSAHRSGGCELRSDAGLHDLQRLPLHRRGVGSRHGLLLVQLAKGGGGGHHRALPLAERPRRFCLSQSVDANEHLHSVSVVANYKCV